MITIVARIATPLLSPRQQMPIGSSASYVVGEGGAAMCGCVEGGSTTVYLICQGFPLQCPDPNELIHYEPN